MWIEVRNTLSKVVRSTEDELAWLDHYLGVPDTKARFRKGGDKNARRPLLNMLDSTFPTGVMPLVIADARQQKITVDVIDLRKPPGGADPKADIEWLHPYQEEIVDACGVKLRGIVHAPTASGKTEIMVALSNVFPYRWGIFVPVSLLKQTVERFAKRTGEACGVIGDGQFDASKRITIASIQSVWSGLRANVPRMMRWLDSLQAIHVDEVHLLPADTFYRTIMATPNAFYRYGYSATPFARGDRKGLLAVAAIGPTICRIQPETLIEIGAVAAPKVRMIKHVAALSNAWRYSDVYGDTIVHNQARNALITQIVKKGKFPAIVFVREISHGRDELMPMLTNAGIAAEFVWGEKKSFQRDAAVKRLQNADVDVLIANVVFQAGVDIPELMHVVNAAGGKAHIPVVQQTGRGSRRFDATTGAVVKDAFDVTDVADTDCGCAYKDENGRTAWKHKSCEWLVRHSRSRRAAYVGEGYSLVEVNVP